MPFEGLKHLTPIRGLSEADARARLQIEGYNELPRPTRRTPLRIILEVMREPMLALLLGGGVIYLLLGDLKEALILLAFATLSVLITVVQETRTERVLEALRDLTSPRALVIRDGKPQRIAGREVVRGDFVMLAEGDRVPADAVLVESHDLETDESLLTGESVPVCKVACVGGSLRKDPRPGGDDLPYVFSGSCATTGRIAVFGDWRGRNRDWRSERDGPAQRDRQDRPDARHSRDRTPAPPGTDPPTRAGVCCRRRNGQRAGGGALRTLRGGWLDAVLAGIALGMSMLPEELPVVLTVFMAMGAWRISRARVLTRRAAAIEALGSATVLCTDKTGTLTENRMSIAELRLKTGEVLHLRKASMVPEAFHELAEFGVLASARDSFDPMEKAFHDLDRERLAETRHLHASEWKLLHTYGLRPDLLAVSNVCQTSDGTVELVIAAKGAPEATCQLCHLDAVETAAVTQHVNAMAVEGLRVLGVARAFFAGHPWPESQHEFAFEFVGLVGIADPLRPSVPDAVNQCRSAGIKVVMITGDYPATAKAIARHAGLESEDVMTGDELERMGDAELAVRLRSATVFARIMSEQKLRIVNALKANGEIVAMTGDGVNDAPALKSAHIGIAMGGRGTDVAREASSIVLLDDDFGSIVSSIRLGRRIYDNLCKTTSFIFAVHVPIGGLAPWCSAYRSFSVPYTLPS